MDMKEYKRIHNRKYKAENKARLNANDRAYHWANREKILERKRSYERSSFFRYDRPSRRETRLQATPSWINRNNILGIYANCPIGYDVDHIVPIKGVTPDGYEVCGLNVPWNMQYLESEINLSKGNRMTKRCYRIACSLKRKIN